MNPYPLGGPPPEITLKWAFHPRDLANSLNPLDHPWNFDPSMVAKHRLRAIVRTDREACGDGKWVKVSEGFYFEWPLDEPRPIFVANKPRYRWERRR